MQDRAFHRQSTMVKNAQASDDGSPSWAVTARNYVEWLSRCWRSHRAAKVIRLQNHSLHQLLEPIGGRRLHAIYLVRAPAAVIASRLTLPSFRRRGPFNPDGTPLGVVRQVCASMTAKLEVRHSRLMRLRLEDFLAAPLDSLARMFAHLGVGPSNTHAAAVDNVSWSPSRTSGLPSEVISVVRRCISSSTTEQPRRSRSAAPLPARRLAERPTPGYFRRAGSRSGSVRQQSVPPAFSIYDAEERRKRRSSLGALATGQLRDAVVEQCDAVLRAWDYRAPTRGPPPLPPASSQLEGTALGSVERAQRGATGVI